MPTTKKRINISVPDDVDKALKRAARRDNVPEATKALSLLELALEIEEDVAFDRIASHRYRTANTWLTHQDVWGN
jgi:hypothetical protein